MSSSLLSSLPGSLDPTALWKGTMCAHVCLVKVVLLLDPLKLVSELVDRVCERADVLEVNEVEGGRVSFDVSSDERVLRPSRDVSTHSCSVVEEEQSWTRRRSGHGREGMRNWGSDGRCCDH